MSGEIHASAVQLSAIDGESATDAVRSELSTRISQANAETTGATAWGVDGGRNWFRFRGERNAFDSTGDTGRPVRRSWRRRFDQRLCDGSGLDAVAALAVRRRRQLCDGPDGPQRIEGLDDIYLATRSGLRGIRRSWLGRRWRRRRRTDRVSDDARGAVHCARTRRRQAARRCGSDGHQPAVGNRRRTVERSANRQAPWNVEGSTHRRRSPRPIWVERIHRDGRRFAVAVGAGPIDQLAAS